MQPARTNEFQHRWALSLFLAAGAVIILLCCGLLAHSVGGVASITPPSVSDPGLLTCQLEEISMESGYVVISGYAYLPGNSIRTVQNSVVLVDTTSGDCLRIPTAMSPRGDLQEQDDQGRHFSYVNGGFLARCRLDKLQAPPSAYRIYLRYENDGNDLFVDTGRSLSPESGAVTEGGQ